MAAMMEVGDTRVWRLAQGFPRDREVRVDFPLAAGLARLLRQEELPTFRAAARIRRWGLWDAGGMTETSL